nr:hypothetical protein [uncultured Brevundimonas sp.]
MEFVRPDPVVRRLEIFGFVASIVFGRRGDFDPRRENPATFFATVTQIVQQGIGSRCFHVGIGLPVGASVELGTGVLSFRRAGFQIMTGYGVSSLGEPWRVKAIPVRI